MIESSRLAISRGRAASTAAALEHSTRLRAEEPDPPPETTTIRLAKSPSICIAPVYVVSDLLKEEGFTNVVHVEAGFVGIGAAQRQSYLEKQRRRLQSELLWSTSSRDRSRLEHYHSGRDSVGCFELFAREGIRSVADLKGRTVGVQSL